MAFLRWVGCALLWATTCAAETKSELTAKLVRTLHSVLTEQEATEILTPYLEDLKQLEVQVMEKVLSRQWWTLSRDMVSRSHTQGVDFSFAVRKAVSSLKEGADELLRMLNPKYGVAQQVAPAFQWAQNDTCIFLTVKYTVRWNAPGALEVTEPVVNITPPSFNFTGLGKHSNNKYRYVLSINVFDNIAPKGSTWSLASVGKLSVTLKKRWPRKWPRLLADKKHKIQNMHLWMEMQDTMDSQFAGMTAIANSPLTCGLSGTLYCVATDTCKKPANCSQCPGKHIPVMEEHICTGMPQEKASLNFKDADGDEKEIGGDVKIIKARNQFDIDTYSVYFGKDDRNRLETEEGKFLLIGEVEPTTSDTEVRLPHNTQVPQGATHLLVFSKNAHGEYANPGSHLITDVVLPKFKPQGLTFEDEDGDKGEVSGTVTIERAENEDHVDDYVIHWGKSAHKKLPASSYIGIASNTKSKAVPYEGRPAPTYHISKDRKIPDGATHLLAYSKNTQGESSSAASRKLVDHTKPCLKYGNKDCVAEVAVRFDEQLHVSVTRAVTEKSVTQYDLYWGKRACGPSGIPDIDPKNHIRDLLVSESVSITLPGGTEVPEWSTHLLAFSANKFGRSDFCASAVLQRPAAK